MTGCACVLLVCVLWGFWFVVGLVCFWWYVCIVMIWCICVCCMLTYFTRFVMPCQWCVVSVLLGDMWLGIVYVLPCVLFMTCTYMSVYELNQTGYPYPTMSLGHRWQKSSDQQGMCVCMREICMCVWGLLTCIYDLNYLLMLPSSKVTSTDITNAPSDCFL